MSFGDECALLTAGHILEGLDNRVRDGQAQVWATGLFHGMGYKPAIEVPMEFPYLTEKHWHEQSMAKGIDIGAVHIAPAFRSQCEANGVACLSAEDILNFPPPEFQEYVAMGVPLFTYSQKEHELDGDIGHEGRSQLVGMPVRIAEAPTDILPTEYPVSSFDPNKSCRTTRSMG